jgi:hypothetical protein
MLWEALHFFVGLVEVLAVIASILVVGLIVASGAFWILSRCLGKLAGSAGSDLYGDEMDDCLAVKAIPMSPDDTSPSQASDTPRLISSSVSGLRI